MAKNAVRPVEDIPAKSWMRDSVCYVRGRAFIDGTDEVARTMEAKWGVDRLRCLVGDDLRARFDSQRLKFNQAIRTGDLSELETEALRMRRAWQALDAAADAAGAERLSPDAWEVALPSGGVAVIVKDRDGYRSSMVAGRSVQVFELQEIATLIEGFPDIVRAKDVFPGATVTYAGPRRDPIQDMELNDAIPF